MVLKMLKDKSLVITKSCSTYQDENNAETLKVILPRNLNGVDLSSCFIYFNFTNQSGVGNVCDITSYLKSYSDIHYVVEFPMYQMFTHEPGKIEMWVKILHPQTEMVAKTNSVSHIVVAHKDVEDILPKPELSVIDKLVTQVSSVESTIEDMNTHITAIDSSVEELEERVNNVADTLEDVISGDQQITQNMILGRVHE